MVKELQVSTNKRYQLVDLTEQVEGIVSQSGIDSGIAIVFVPHSTAGILLTENEQGLIQDWLNLFKKITSGINFAHNKIDDNADSHLLSGLVGQGKTLVIEDGRLIRGTWQQIFLAEFDGPRQRRILIKIIKG
ncbi:YjbQ family protein [bacterium]|nr:YjbQ family protein [bacterium]